MSTQALLINVLSQHHGRDNGIKADDLAHQLGVPVRRLRLLITAAREEGFAVCGTPGTGYFMPLTADELNAGCAFLEHRAKKSLLLLQRMRRLSLPELLGQLKLNQA